MIFFFISFFYFFLHSILNNVLPTYKATVYSIGFNFMGLCTKIKVPNLLPLSSITKLFDLSKEIVACVLETEISFNFISHSYILPILIVFFLFNSMT